ncbi:MAG: flavodoxin domain-containing protein [Actinomycetota bacterium]
MRVIVASASKHGSTEGIAEAIAERLRQLGHDAVAVRVADVSDLNGVHAVVLGSAIYAGSWMKEATEFAEVNADVLSGLPVWLFSSGPLGTEVDDDEEQPRQLAELNETLRPRTHRMFFGALDRTKLGFSERMMVKAVKAPEGDFRDWNAISAWADEIGRELAEG